MNDSLMDFQHRSQTNQCQTNAATIPRHLSPLLTHCGSSGFLCILQPLHDESYECTKNTMLTPSEYMEKRKEVLALREYDGEEFMDNGRREKMRGPAFQPRDPKSVKRE